MTCFLTQALLSLVAAGIGGLIGWYLRHFKGVDQAEIITSAPYKKIAADYEASNANYSTLQQQYTQLKSNHDSAVTEKATAIQALTAYKAASQARNRAEKKRIELSSSQTVTEESALVEPQGVMSAASATAQTTPTSEITEATILSASKPQILEVVKEIELTNIIDRPVETVKEIVVEKRVEVPAVNTIQSLAQTNVTPKEIIREVEKIVEVPVEVVREVEKFIEVEKVVKVIKVVEVPKEVIRKVSVIKEVPTDTIREVEKIVEVIKEVPVEVIREVEVIKEVEKIVEVPVEVIKEVQVIKEVERIVEVPVEVIKEVQVIKEVEVIKEVPVEVIKEVDRIVNIPVEVLQEVERIVEVPVEVIKEVERIIEVPVEVIKEVEIIKEVERIIEVPVEVIKEVEKQVSTPVEIIKERIVEVPIEVIKELELTAIEEVVFETVIEKQVDVPVKVIKEVEKVVNIPIEVIKEVEKIVEVPVEVIKEVEKIVEVPVEVIKEVEKVVNIPVEVIKEVEKIVEVPVEVIKEVEKIVEVPVEVIKEVERIVNVPVESVRNVERIVEVPIEVIKEIELTRIEDRPVETIREIEKQIQVPVEVIKEIPIEVVKEIELTSIEEKPVETIVEVKSDASTNSLSALSKSNTNIVTRSSVNQDEQGFVYEEAKITQAEYGFTASSYSLFRTAGSTIGPITYDTVDDLGDSRYYFWQGADNFYYYCITDNQGKVLLFSDGFSSKRVRDNAFEYLRTQLYSPIHFRKFENQEGNYFFHFFGDDEEIYGSSPAYEDVSELSDSIIFITLQNSRKDDLKIVEGIGPKIEGLLNAADIMTWEKLSQTPIGDIQQVLENAGPRYRMHNPATWADQAGMAHRGEWNALKKWQDQLDGGIA